MDTNIKFQKIKTTERALDLKPTKFSRIFLMDTTITILNDCILFGDYKINLRVKHASKSNNFLVFNTIKSLYLLDFKIKVLYRFEGDEQDFIKAEFNGEDLEILYSNGIYKSYKIGEILEDKEIEIREEEGVGYFYKGGKVINKVGDKYDDVKVDKDDNINNDDYDDILFTPFGDIFIKNEKMIFKDQEIENELFYGDNNDKIYYYSTSFKDFILLGSSNNSNLYLYDFNLNVMDNEGEDAIYIQADENHNQLYIRGMDYNKGRLVFIDLKGNVVEYYVKINNELNGKL
ncbi:hypothetical protein NBO_1135g0003 [Nosema bombycis CQ1]|uniref:Uncharacterized protein n=1 Tax=Nosema bombycis (strain CQ1 / CVCC 102059) TaxID=578461 RepID=R0KMX7_NOSB1|nr:hypothetical protein NBO_1135g0003 [Nosema bombycis CQ1]|eukprot:EOB11487.1 hypothetical protein NBO_1135g0003 [Nosema bombycis CQ1]